MGFINNKIIAAVRGREDLAAAAESPANIIFLLNSNIMSLQKDIEPVRSNKKKLFLHIDLAEGIGKDKPGVEFAAQMGINGVISTRVNIIRAAKSCGLATVQRFFIVDSHSMLTAIDSLNAAKPDLIEIMPGIMPKMIARFKEKIKVPIIAGGLIETKNDVESAIIAGASAVSTTKKQLWNLGGF